MKKYTLAKTQKVPASRKAQIRMDLARVIASALQRDVDRNTCDPQMALRFKLGIKFS
jgi:hypothetical protein